jgi:hypothetical protein
MRPQHTRFTLYSGPLSMFGAKAQIAALEKGLDFELVMVPYDYHLGYRPKLLEWRHRMTRRPAVGSVVKAMTDRLCAAARPLPAFMNSAGSS